MISIGLRKAKITDKSLVVAFDYALDGLRMGKRLPSAITDHGMKIYGLLMQIPNKLKKNQRAKGLI